MTNLFLGGSISISKLNDRIIERLQSIMMQKPHLLVGDAPGADKAFQEYLAVQKYPDVTVYHSGPFCRNNLGKWKTVSVLAPKSLKGTAFYAAKDLRMAQDATEGFMLWDGSSRGTRANIQVLCKAGKNCLLYVSANTHLYSITNQATLESIMDKIAANVRRGNTPNVSLTAKEDSHVF